MLPPPAQPPVAKPPTVAASVPIPPIGGEIPVGKTPGFVAIAPNGKLAYIANRAAGVVTVVDTAVNKVAATIPIPDGPPQYLAFAPDGTRLYVSVFNDPDRSINRVVVLDTQQHGRHHDPGRHPPVRRWRSSPDGSEVYVPNHDSGTVSVIDTSVEHPDHRHPGAPNPHWVAFSRDGTPRLHRQPRVEPDQRHRHRAPVGGRPRSRCRSSPHSVAMHPTQPLLANVNYDSNSVTVIDTNADKVIATCRWASTRRTWRGRRTGGTST